MSRPIAARQSYFFHERAIMPKASNRTVYVVDDDEAVLDSIKVLLESSGLGVRAFSSADAFLADDAALQAACLIADVHMPGTGGLELLARLQARGASIPTIMISGRSDPTLDQRVKRLGAVMLLPKPIDDDELLLIVRSVLPPPDAGS
jgi:two-component system, LuxR family, response regulator FixJ